MIDNEIPKRKRGALLVEAIMLLLFPLICYVIIRAVIMKYQNFSKELNDASARFLGFGIGSLFHITCFIVGVFKNSVLVVKKRMIDFKDNLPISFKFAVKCYLEDMKNDGIAFLVEMACVGFCFAVAISGLLTAIPLL